MKLSDYVDETRGRQTTLALGLGVPPQLVWQWARSVRTVPVSRCTSIERLSGGLVCRWDLRPQDWHIHWPELIGTEGAPLAPGPDAPLPATPPAGTAVRARIDWPTLAGTEGAPPGPDAVAHPPSADWPVCVRRTERHDGPTPATPTEATHAA
jgi:DNA-binding transcriptional regulator YdaS (Cro superfamily)